MAEQLKGEHLQCLRMMQNLWSICKERGWQLEPDEVEALKVCHSKIASLKAQKKDVDGIMAELKRVGDKGDTQGIEHYQDELLDALRFNERIEGRA